MCKNRENVDFFLYFYFRNVRTLDPWSMNIKHVCVCMCVNWICNMNKQFNDVNRTFENVQVTLD